MPDALIFVNINVREIISCDNIMDSGQKPPI